MDMPSSPYEMCIHTLTVELERFQALIVQLKMEDERFKQRHSVGDVAPGHNTAPLPVDISNTKRPSEDLHLPAGTGVPPAEKRDELSSLREHDQPKSDVGDHLSEHSESASNIPDSSPLTPGTRSSREIDQENRAKALQREDSIRWSRTVAIPKQPTKIQNIVQSSRFEFICALVIIMNAITLGVEVDWNARHRDAQEAVLFQILGCIFNFILIVEIVLRILASGWDYFKFSPNVFSNYFDLCLACISLYESSFTVIVFASVDIGDGFSNVSQTRAARLLRVARLLRFVRIARINRFFGALRTLVVSIIGTLRSLFWAMVLLIILTYMFAIVLAQAASDAIVFDNLEMDPQSEDLFLHYWGDLFRAMLTLFASLTGGVSWETPAWALEKIGLHMVLLFLIFISFTYFAVLNVFIAVFVQSAAESAQQDQDVIVQTKIGQKKAYLELLRRLFDRIDMNGSGQISCQELESRFGDEEVQASFESLEIRVDCAWTLFKLLDADGGHSLDLEEFQAGCLRLRGGARTVDLASMRAEYEYLEIRLQKFMSLTESALVKILRQLTTMSAQKLRRSVAI